MGQPSKEWRKNDELANKPWRKNDEFAYRKQALKTNFQSSSTRPGSSLGTEGRKTPNSSKAKNSDEKLAALMAYRKAKGLCYKCGLRWGPNHQCAESVPLHVVEELRQMLNVERNSTEMQAESDSEEDLMAISAQADSGTTDGRTIKLFCHVHKHPAVIYGGFRQ